MDTITMAWENCQDKKVSREVRQLLDVRDYVGTPGYALLVLAANINLSIADLERFLSLQGVTRSSSWIQRRRWLFLQPDAPRTNGRRPNQDGNDDRAKALIGEHPKRSLRDLSTLLHDHGINRSREWIRQNRCEAVMANNQP